VYGLIVIHNHYTVDIILAILITLLVTTHQPLLNFGVSFLYPDYHLWFPIHTPTRAQAEIMALATEELRKQTKRKQSNAISTTVTSTVTSTITPNGDIPRAISDSTGTNSIPVATSFISQSQGFHLPVNDTIFQPASDQQVIIPNRSLDTKLEAFDLEENLIHQLDPEDIENHVQFRLCYPLSYDQPSISLSEDTLRKRSRLSNYF